MLYIFCSSRVLLLLSFFYPAVLLEHKYVGFILLSITLMIITSVKKRYLRGDTCVTKILCPNTLSTNVFCTNIFACGSFQSMKASESIFVNIFSRRDYNDSGDVLMIALQLIVIIYVSKLKLCVSYLREREKQVV